MLEGLYILANDVVLNQLIALVNSIRTNAGALYPICVIPYDDRLAATRQYLETQPGNEVFLLEDKTLIAKWESFASQIWQASSKAQADWNRRGITGVSRMGMHRRFCAFDGPFDRFIYLDADTLVMGDLAPIFSELSHHDWVVYDFQYKDPGHVYDVTSAKLHQVFNAERISTEIFCAGMYASRRGIFSIEFQKQCLRDLQAGEVDILYYNGPDQSIVNYMVMKSEIDNYNLALKLPPQERTGCCVTSSHFEARDFVLYDKGKRLTYLHYIGVPSGLINRVCSGENLDFPYREIFLHYRYLRQPEARPRFSQPLQPYGPQPLSLRQRLLQKLSILFGAKGG